MKTKFIFILISCFLLIGCQTTNISKESISQENIPNSKAIQTLLLDNGIVVNLQNDKYATSNSILICFNNSITDVSLEYSGIYKTLFDLLKQESKNYTSQNLQRLLYIKNASIDSYTSRDGQYLSLTCLTKYFDQLLPIYFDCLLSPNFESADNYILKQKNNLNSEVKKDISLLLANMSSDLCKSTNYFGKTSLTKESVNTINKEVLRTFYENMFTKDNITIICTGNYNKKELISQLNQFIGTKKLKDKKTQSDIFVELQNHPQYTTFTNSISSKIDYSFSILPIPKLTEKEFISYYLLSLIYSDILYNTTREKYGSCYSIYSDILLLEQPFFCTYGIRISNKENFFKSIDEAKKIILDKKIIVGKADDDFIYAPLEEKITSYKNLLINKIYANKYTSQKKANLLALGLFTANDINYYPSIIQQLNNLTYKDICETIDELFTNSEKWFYLTGEK